MEEHVQERMLRRACSGENVLKKYLEKRVKKTTFTNLHEKLYHKGRKDVSYDVRRISRKS